MTNFHRADEIAKAERQDAYYIEHLLRNDSGSTGPWKHPAPKPESGVYWPSVIFNLVGVACILALGGLVMLAQMIVWAG